MIIVIMRETLSSDLLIFLFLFIFFSSDVARNRMNRAPNETRTHSWRFASQAC